ncbi:cell division protein FtsZ [Ramlibacter alkalitolerans]|uniref:Cell division protein FtsZ n=1 Tax=Ramlibacter alkalitolerans TaxID=2039631 RepID=A0ABS1JW18_9BURK|nr:cell division protein FtsZ [Ramlibacter alkalitolerans]
MKNESEQPSIIKVIGVGGAGGNAVRHMIQKDFSGVQFVCANTDVQALAATGAASLLKLGETGLGAGSNPDVGREAAREAKKQVAEALRGANMLFITAGMGGGTGTGAAPVIAEIAREMGILTVGVVTKPFAFEGARRRKQAEAGIYELAQHVNSLVVVLNDKLLEVLGEDVTQKDAFAAADDVLYGAVSGITEVITGAGVVNVDFMDVRTVMSNTGRAMMGYGAAAGPERAATAARQAIACPLLEGVNLASAKGVLVNITASSESLRMREPREVMDIIRGFVDEDATIIYGAVYDDSMGDAIRVTVVATGLEDASGARGTPAAAAPSTVTVPVLTEVVAKPPIEEPAVAKPRTAFDDPWAARERPAVFRSNRASALPLDVDLQELAQGPGPVQGRATPEVPASLPVRQPARPSHERKELAQTRQSHKEGEGWLNDRIPAWLRKAAA